jgi:hypothetical protein
MVKKVKCDMYKCTKQMGEYEEGAFLKIVRPGRRGACRDLLASQIFGGRRPSTMTTLVKTCYWILLIDWLRGYVIYIELRWGPSYISILNEVGTLRLDLISTSPWLPTRIKVSKSLYSLQAGLRKAESWHSDDCTKGTLFRLEKGEEGLS